MMRLIFALLLAFLPLRQAVALDLTGAIGGGSGSGTVTSITPGCGSSTSPNPLTTTGVIATTMPEDLETGSNFPIPNSDCGFLINLSNASAQTPTIAQAGVGGNFVAGWFAHVCNIGAGTQTLTPTVSTIGGNASQAIRTGQCFDLQSNGTNYRVAGSGLGASPCTTTAATFQFNNSGAFGCSGVAFESASDAVLGIGGTTSGHPGLRDDGNGALGVVLADNSAYTKIAAGPIVADGSVTTTTGTVYIDNDTTAQVQFGTAGDVDLYRISAGLLGLTNSTPGTYRDLELRSLVSGGTAPSISGCSAGTQTGGGTAGTYKSGTSGTCTVTLTFALTAPTGWSCYANDQTTPADVQKQIAGGSTTTAVISGTTVTADVVSFGCVAY